MVWISEQEDWSQLPHQKNVLNFEPPTIGGGTAYSLANLSKLQETWDSLEAFQKHVFQVLTGASLQIYGEVDQNPLKEDKYTVFSKAKVISFFRNLSLRRLALLFTFSILSFLATVVIHNYFQESTLPNSSRLLLTTSSMSIPRAIIDRASFGEKYLIDSQYNPCNVSEESRNICQQNGSETLDPEELIYKNNQKIEGKEAYNIAITVPLSIEDPGNAIMMLRGFAQAQDIINRSPNSPRIRLIIVNDSGDATIARRIANALVSEIDIAAVLGHWSSFVSKAAADIYSEKELVFITPISIFDDLENMPYVFRVNATSKKGAEKLSQYAKQEIKAKEAYVFFDLRNPYTEELKIELVELLNRTGIKIKSEIDIATFNDNETELVFENNLRSKIQEQEDVLVVFIPTNKSFKFSLELIKELRKYDRDIPILGDMANLYIPETLRGIYNAEDMVLAPSWVWDENSENSFVKAISEGEYWKGHQVNYAAAMSYTALEAIAKALEKIQDRVNPTHADLERTLRDGLSIQGAFNQSVKFKETGESTVDAQLVKVCPKIDENSSTDENLSFDFKFHAISLSNPNCPS